MKKIEAIIRPSRLDDVKRALDEAGIEEMTASEIRGFGRQKAHREVFRGTERTVDYLPEIKIEMMLPDHSLEAAVAALIRGMGTARAGDVKVFVSTVEDALGIEAEKIGEHVF